MTPLSPSTDTHITKRYGSTSLEGKLANKTALQEEIGWAPEPKRPLICLPAGMTEKLGGKLFEELLPGLLSLPIEILVVGKGSANYGTLFTKLAKEHKHRLHIVPEKDDLMRKMYAASDMALFLNDPRGSKELEWCLAYGVVPLSIQSDALEDYDPVQESGNSFSFAEANPWLCFASLVRAMETYKLPYDWRTIVKHGMQTAQEM
jgi:starch synthase